MNMGNSIIDFNEKKRFIRRWLLPDKGEKRVIEEDNQLYDREKEEKIKELKEEYQKALEKQ